MNENGSLGGESGYIHQETNTTILKLSAVFEDFTSTFGFVPDASFAVHLAIASGLEPKEFPFHSEQFERQMRIGALDAVATRRLIEVTERNNSPVAIKMAEMDYLAAQMAITTYLVEHPTEENPSIKYQSKKRAHLNYYIVPALENTLGRKLTSDETQELNEGYDISIARLGIPSQRDRQ